MILAPYDGVTKPSLIKLDFLDIWVQIHDVPDLYAHLVGPLAAKVGEVLHVEQQYQDFTGNFYRVWVRIKVDKPLKNVVLMIREGKRQIYRVKYERPPDWCAVCGMLGHLFKEHGNGVHPPSALVFKDLRASWYMRSGKGPGEGRGRRGCRRGGRSGGRSKFSEGGYEHDDKDGYSEEEDGSENPKEDAVMDENNRKKAISTENAALGAEGRHPLCGWVGAASGRHVLSLAAEWGRHLGAVLLLLRCLPFCFIFLCTN